jgi:hypothetical protein
VGFCLLIKQKKEKKKIKIRTREEKKSVGRDE